MPFVCKDHRRKVGAQITILLMTVVFCVFASCFFTPAVSFAQESTTTNLSPVPKTTPEPTRPVDRTDAVEPTKPVEPHIEEDADDVAARVGTENARETTIEEMNEAPSYLDGALVKFTGEVIGDVIDGPRSQVWLLVSQDDASISVLIPHTYLDQVENYGRYGVEGTMVSVVGVYHVADSTMAGELYVSGTSLKQISPGQQLDMPFSSWKIYTGVGFLVAAGILTLLYRYLQRRSL